MMKIWKAIAMRFGLTAKKMVPADGKPDDSFNAYYAGVSRYYHITGFAAFALLAVFLLASVIFGYKEFTYENLYYFIKDFDSVLTSESYFADAVDYGYEENRVCAVYKGGVAVAGKYTADVYSATGRRTAHFNTGYSAPVIRASSKYLLIYDSAGAGYSIYNSFIRLRSQTLDNTIYAADINDNGEVIIQTSDSEYRSVIYLYDSGSELAAAYRIKDYVTCSDLSNDGKYIAAASVSAENGGYAYSLRLYRRGETEPVILLSGSDELPLSCGFGGGKCYLITDKKITVVDMSGNIISDMRLSEGGKYLGFDRNEKGVAASAYDNGVYCIIYIPFAGNASTVALDEKPEDIGTGADRVYVLSRGAVSKYDFSDGTLSRQKCADSAAELLVSSDGHIYICYSSRAVCSEF